MHMDYPWEEDVPYWFWGQKVKGQAHWTSGLGSITKSDYDYDFDYMSQKTLDYNYDYDYLTIYFFDYDYIFNYNPLIFLITIIIMIICPLTDQLRLRFWLKLLITTALQLQKQKYWN